MPRPVVPMAASPRASSPPLSHVALDKPRELARDAAAIGTTGRGIGPAYEDKVARRAVRLADLFQPQRLAERLRDALDYHNFELQHRYSLPACDYQQVYDQHLAMAAQLR